MSDTRRRRKSNQSCGSDDLSDSYDELNATKGTQSSEQTDGHQDSECDIYASDSEFESQDGAQRESGDGQEEDKPQKKLDDDEDRRNPQYIPKRGTFYEHDDRTAEEVTDEKAEVPAERETKEKKVWKDKEDRWDHDRYNDEEQAPKSHEELIAVYGYDIRNEEGPPRARRRRRYGRGPNKYTRNWEDEDAYGKTGTNTSSSKNHRRFNRTGEDFPALGTNKDTPGPVEEPVISSAWYSSKSKPQNKVQNFPSLQPQSNSPKTKTTGPPNSLTNENKAPNEPTNPAWKKDTKQGSHNQNTNTSNGPSNDGENIVNAKTSPRDNSKRNAQESMNLAGNRTRGRGFKANTNNTISNRMVENKPKGRGAGPINADNRRNNVLENNDQNHTHDANHSSANDNVPFQQTGKHNKNFHNQSNNQQRANALPARMHQQSHTQQQHQQPSQQQQSHQQQPVQQQQQQQQQPSQQQQQQQQQQQSQPQPQDSSSTRPKRYSSLRQRPAISDGPGQQNYPAQHNQHGQHGQHGQHAQHSQHGQHGQQHSQHSQHTQHAQHGQHGQHGYFPPQAGNSRGVLESPGYPQGHFEQPTPVAAAVGATAPMAGQPVIPLPPSGQPASYAPPPFLVPPPQFIPPQTAPPSIINYVPGPNGPTFQANFQGYQGYSPPVQPQRPPPPQELYQPQGCTYYSPAQQQQQQQQVAPLRRPKAAIPILPPPENQQHQAGKGRGKIMHQQNNQPGNAPISDQEIKSNLVEGGNTTVQDQYGNLETDQLEQVDQIRKNKDLSAITEYEVANEEENVKNVDIETPVITENTAIDDVHGETVKISSDTVFDEQDITSTESAEMLIPQTESELSKIEAATSEIAIVEEAAA